MNYQRYGQALKYASDRARAVMWGEEHDGGSREASRDVATMAGDVARHGDRTLMGIMGDYVEEHDHPIADYLRRAMQVGEEITDRHPHRYLEQDALRAHPFPEQPDATRAPHTHFLLGEGDGNLSATVLRTRNGLQHLALTFSTGGFDTRRTYHVPISDEELRTLASDCRLMDSIPHAGFADQIEEVLDRPHPSWNEELNRPARFARKAPVPAPPTSTDTAALFRALATTHKHELTDRSGRGIIRAVLADALQEEGRDGEAAVARSTDPIAIHHGRIWSGNYDSLPASAQEYVRTALGLQPYRGGTMDEYVDPRDLHPDHIARLHADWVTFAAAHEKFPGEIAPHHFHLSRNQDGGGFEDHPEEYGDKRSVKLEAAARQYGIHRLSRPQRQPPSQTI